MNIFLGIFVVEFWPQTPEQQQWQQQFVQRKQEWKWEQQYKLLLFPELHGQPELRLRTQQEGIQPVPSSCCQNSIFISCTLPRQYEIQVIS